ncbi:DUF6183 family protein [Kitasatospora sp. MAP5-34]|uniref:DUF6183 family protein n=1 Tax=Kitasatospora sp. MAP5-34 TaxID=3035102 RepID=UPI0024743DCA|nr:DUF6183 family protein [Kitasatospora sp. MAP5-34]MDH6574610.1 hypothetical protein [Kitasatospora sp. MAP5-34]
MNGDQHQAPIEPGALPGELPPEVPPLPDAGSLKACAATDPARLYELAVAHLRRPGPESARAISWIAEPLCTEDSYQAAEWAARLADTLLTLTGPDDHRMLVRRMARQLVQRAGWVTLKPLFEQLPEHLDGPAEFRACLLQEIALRWGVDAEPYLEYARRLQELRHPLAWLPLASLRFEHELCRTTEGSMPGSMSPATLRAAYPEIPPTEAGTAAGGRAREVPDTGRAEAAGAPLAQLGRWEAKFYVLAQPLDPDDWNAAFLAELPAQCLAGTTTDTIVAVHTTADDLAGDLFVSAYSGGLWGESRQGAYSRLLTWHSLYALLDLDLTVSPYDAVRLAARHHWLRFAVDEHSDNQWFHREVTDLGFAVLDPGRTRIALLAATDTD